MVDYINLIVVKMLQNEGFSNVNTFKYHWNLMLAFKDTV